MKYVGNYMGKTQVVIFAVLFVVFTVWTYLITDAGVDDGPTHDTRVFQATVGTITGPLTGAISRGFQGCCLEFSLDVMKYCGPILVLGVLAQFTGPRRGKWAPRVRITLWTLAWLIWFLGGIFSFLHALG